MKKLIVLILTCLTLSASAGIDEMKQRQAGQPPVEQSDAPGNGQGGGIGNNPNVPIDGGTLMVMFVALIVTVGIISIQNQYNRTNHKQ